MTYAYGHVIIEQVIVIKSDTKANAGNSLHPVFLTNIKMKLMFNVKNKINTSGPCRHSNANIDDYNLV